MDHSPPPRGGLLQHHALPVPATAVAPAAVPATVPKHFLAAFFLSFFLGVFGADRFYLGKYPSAVLKLVTFGGFGIVAIVDLALIMNGAMRGPNETPLAGYEEYRGLAKRVVAWVTVGACLFIVVNVAVTAVFVMQLVNQFQSATSPSGLLGGSGGSSSSGSDNGDLNKLLSESGL